MYVGKSGRIGRRGKGEVEAELEESVKEADRRRTFVESNARNLKHRLSASRKHAELDNKVRLAENSSLMYECNDLRWQVRELERKLQTTEVQLSHAMRARKVPVGSLSMSRLPLVETTVEGAEGLVTSHSIGNLLDIKGAVRRGSEGKADDASMSDSADHPTGATQVRKELPRLIRPKDIAAKNAKGRLAHELETLVVQLDEAHKEKEMHRIEANRMRRQLAQLQKSNAALQRGDFLRYTGDSAVKFSPKRPPTIVPGVNSYNLVCFFIALS